MKCLFAIGLLIAISYCAFDADEVKSMPLWGEMTSRMWSGYLDIPDTQKKLHYLFVESQSNPKEDPILIWFNGGPGCSSMGGMLAEHGPYVIEDGTHVFTKNEWSWNKEANVLYYNQPAGVGYSICGNEDECWFDDESVSHDNLAAFNFFLEKKFPEFKDHDVYISGESYAGIYVPYLGYRIWEQNKAGQKPKINLKGVAVGNGVADWNFDTQPSFIEIGYYHGLMSLELKNKIAAAKCDFGKLEWRAEEISEECQQYMVEFMTTTRFADINIYDIYGKCWLDKGEEEASRMRETETVWIDGEPKTYKLGMTAYEYTPWLFPGLQKYGEDDPPMPDPAPCLFMAPLTKYTNRADVREALHIPSSLPAFEMCNFEVLATYTKLEKGSKWIYEALRKEGIKFLIFAGDTDGAVPSSGNQRWIHSLNWARTEDWRAYYVDKQVAGYVEKFEALTFGTVHGAGHMAPQWRRPQNYHLVFQWIKNAKI